MMMISRLAREHRTLYSCPSTTRYLCPFQEPQGAFNLKDFMVDAHKGRDSQKQQRQVTFAETIVSAPLININFCFWSFLTMFIKFPIILVDAFSIFASFSAVTVFINAWIILVDAFSIFASFSAVTVFINAWIILVGASSIFASFSAVTVFINVWIILVDASSIFASFLLSPFSSMLGLYWLMLPVFLLLFCCHRFRRCLDYTGWCFQYFCFFSAVTVFVNAWIILVGASSIFASFLLSPFSSMLGLYWLMLPVFLLLFCRQFSSMLGL